MMIVGLVMQSEYDKKIIELIEEVITKDNIFKLKVYGKSMYPFIEEGSIVSIKKISYENIKIGDIIFYRYTDNLFAHRVIYKYNNEIITKGDNLISLSRIKKEQIIGKVIAINEKEISNLINYLFVIYSLISGIIIYLAFKIKKLIFKENKNKFTNLIGKILDNFFYLQEKVLIRIFR